MWARHCDGPDCDTWQLDGNGLPDTFFTVTSGISGPAESHFCSADCLLKHFAKYEPMETIPT